MNSPKSKTKEKKGVRWHQNCYYRIMNNIAPVKIIENKIYIIRGQKVMLDSDLAKLYGVATFNLNKAVKRNRERFPKDFMFQLNMEECSTLRFQFGMSRWGGRRTFPYAFTENGIAMLSSVLRSKHAIQVNILIMRAFTKLRELFANHKELALKVNELENKYSKHEVEISAVFKVLKQLLQPASKKPTKKFGFHP